MIKPTGETAMKKHLLNVSLLFSLLATSASVAQAQQWCGTKVRDQYINSSGDLVVYASIRNDYLQVCNLNTTWKSVTPQTCAGWYGLIKSAVSRNASMTFLYNESTPCTSIPRYGDAPVPIYIMLNN